MAWVIGLPLLALWYMFLQFNGYLAIGSALVVVLLIGVLWLKDNRRFDALSPEEQNQERATRAESVKLRAARRRQPDCVQRTSLNAVTVVPATGCLLGP